MPWSGEASVSRPGTTPSSVLPGLRSHVSLEKVPPVFTTILHPCGGGLGGRRPRLPAGQKLARRGRPRPQLRRIGAGTPAFPAPPGQASSGVGGGRESEPSRAARRRWQHRGQLPRQVTPLLCVATVTVSSFSNVLLGEEAQELRLLSLGEG